MHTLLKVLLLPFTALYALGIALRNFFYHSGIITRTSFDIPIICVGNIAAGGTGKTPHIDWLVGKLKNQYQLALLSRGYGRKTVGYVAAYPKITPAQLGDEPLQLYRKHRIPVVACENRVMGVPSLLGDFPDTQCILMDDGMQHLPIKAGLYIMLTQYQHLFTHDMLLPSGRLREFKSAYKRADIIVVTKCPIDISESMKQSIISEINPLPEQKILFSHIAYKPLLFANGDTPVLSADASFILVTAIAGADLLITHLQQHGKIAHHFEYPDHHAFTETDVHNWLHKLKLTSGNTYLVCTEKDVVKLDGFMHDLAPHLLVAPIEIAMNTDDEQALLKQVTTFIDTFPIEET
jgi:tetraacyldisaccharide 4'-kinase